MGYPTWSSGEKVITLRIQPVHSGDSGMGYPTWSLGEKVITIRIQSVHNGHSGMETGRSDFGGLYWI